jgi:hypothetical protein
MSTGLIFKETYLMIKDYSEHKYNNRNIKIENIKRSKLFEEECNNYRERFDDIVNKIKRQDIALIESARNSFRFSLAADKNPNDKKIEQTVVFMNGKDFLYSEVEAREKTVNSINK